LALKWLRDVKGYDGEAYRNSTSKSYTYAYLLGLHEDMPQYKTFEDAESALLDALLEHCKKEMKNEKD